MPKKKKYNNFHNKNNFQNSYCHQDIKEFWKLTNYKICGTGATERIYLKFVAEFKNVKKANYTFRIGGRFKFGAVPYIKKIIK